MKQASLKSKPAWRPIKSKRVYASPRFNIYEDEVWMPDGSRGIYYYRKSSPGVVIIPFDGQKFVLVNQYRYPIRKRLWELPIGRAENKNFLQQAKKELREETGLTAAKWKYLGSFYPTPGSGNSQGRFFFAQSLQRGSHNREAGEADMRVGRFSLKQVDRMIRQGKIVDGWTISAFYFYKLLLSASL